MLPMSVHTVNYFSHPIGMQSAMIVILPDGPGPFPVVYQLHGQSDDHTGWLRWTTIERHAARLGIAIVLLNGARSFYCDTPGTNRLWEQHILKSVEFVDQTFHTIIAAKHRGIGGLSMGGYGAMKTALAHPEIFGSCVSHSGAVDMAQWMATDNEPDLRDIWPSGRLPAHDDIRKLLAKPGKKPAMYIDCGSEDYLLAQNHTIKADLVKREIPHIYLEYPGAHTWDYWQAHVGEGLDFHAGHFYIQTEKTARRTLKAGPQKAISQRRAQPRG